MPLPAASANAAARAPTAASTRLWQESCPKLAGQQLDSWVATLRLTPIASPQRPRPTTATHRRPPSRQKPKTENALAQKVALKAQTLQRPLKTVR